MKSLYRLATGKQKNKYKVQDHPAKYWGTWTPFGEKRIVKRSDGADSVDKTAGINSRPHKKETLRQANRSIKKRARQILKRQMIDEANDTP